MDRMTFAGIELDSMGWRITNVDGLEVARGDLPPSQPVEVESTHEGFRVRGPDEGAGYWTVDLPHPCDEWEVTSGTDPRSVIEQMEEFIANAQAALAELRRRASPLP